jgi:ABC-2 type transport system ATP-binding protein
MIRIKDLAFSYGKKKRPLFQDLDLELPDGNMYGLLGKNGAGKTTLLKILCGLLIPNAGDCTIDDKIPSHRSPDLLADIYYIPEEFWVPRMKIDTFENTYAPFYPKFDHNLFEEGIEEFELDRTMPLTSMSYGQKKKVLVAFGVASGTRLFLLDEPTNGLDIPSKSIFRKLLAAGLNDDRTFLISTHQVRDMQNLIDPVAILEKGRIIFQADAYDMSRSLRIEQTQREPDSEIVLYTESVPGGYVSVIPADNTGESQIDLELLFNAVLTDPERVQAAMSRTPMEVHNG